MRPLVVVLANPVGERNGTKVVTGEFYITRVMAIQSSRAWICAICSRTPQSEVDHSKDLLEFIPERELGA